MPQAAYKATHGVMTRTNPIPALKFRSAICRTWKRARQSTIGEAIEPEAALQAA